MNHWEWEGMGLKKIFPLISSLHRPADRQSNISGVTRGQGRG